MLALIDYGAGNLHSAQKALEKVAFETGYKGEIKVTASPEEVLKAERIVLPGVGAFGDCAGNLRAISGLVSALNEAVLQKSRPFFGICVGMQLLATQGLEHGTHEGLNWIAGEIDLINPKDATLKVPHMGWNTLDFKQNHSLLNDIDPSLHGYFVHSYHFARIAPQHLVATSDYGGDITAIIAKDNIFGTQFHPEKSQRLGLALLKNFLNWKP
jgi:imidazole glycerol-phosphate synthase subunit HisH